MEEGLILDMAQRTLTMIILVSGPLLGVSLVIGLAVSVFQATTQIQEQTLAFIPKIIAVMISTALFGAFMLRTLVEFTKDIFVNMNTYIGM